MSSPSARPVLKWAGGKARSLPHILAELPDRIETYYEPFVGGGAVFFALANQGRFKKAVLSDRNADLINVYRGLKRDVHAVIRVLSDYRYDHDEYYKIRALDPDGLDEFERAARLIYLNKTGYNGLYRVNSKGKFNVPFGRYKDPRFCDEENLQAAAKALRRVRLEVGDFGSICQEPERGDAVYLDPPYDPISKTANFTAYHRDAFGRTEHKKLAEAFQSLSKRDVAIVLSNSATKFTRGLYKAWHSREISVSRPINSKTSGRGAVHELLVTNRSRT
jgi:DNA adenine methylase